MNEVVVTKLRDQVEFVNGDRGINYPKQGDYNNGSVPFISASDLSNNPLSRGSDYKKKITQSAFERLRSGKVNKGDILLCLRGSLGKLGFISEDMTAAIASSLVILRPLEEKNAGFVYQWLKSPIFQRELKSLDNGSVQGNLSVRSISEINVPSHPPLHQKAIAHILGTLDDKIELNRKMNETLEETAKAIFKSWFVDFDPVRAKMQGRPTGLPDDIAALFPDRLVDSEIGEIPEGWGVCAIADLADTAGGATPSTKVEEYWNGGEISWATPKDLSALEGWHLTKTAKRITEAGLQKISSGLLPTGTVLMSSRAPVGYLAIASQPTAINQGFIALKPKGRVSQHFLMLWCEANMGEIKNRASGTTFAEISKKAFRPIQTCAPSCDAAKAFEELVSPMFERMLLVVQQSELLSNLRDTLLPKLISGELQVPDAEKFLEEAGI